MQLLLAFVFLFLALATGAHIHVFKNTLSQWAVAALSAMASATSAWTTVYFATRFFEDPSRIVLDTFVFKLSMAVPNHPVTDPVVFGNIWLLVCLVPMIAGFMAARELRKIPPLQPVPTKAVPAMQ